MKIRILAFVFALPLLLPAAEAPKLSAVDQQATALESQLNKSLDTSPAAAKVMLELVGLYYKEGRVFGLVRVGERFAKAQSRHPEHRAVMLKLLDGLEVMSRREDFITIGRQYLSRYPDSAEALDVALRLSDALERNRKRAEAADALRLLWEHKPVPAHRKAAERASELYGQEGNHQLRIRSAQLAESLMEKLPASPYTVRSGFRAVHEYRHLSRWAEATQVATKMFEKRQPLSRVMQHELHRLMAASYASQSQWANADASLRKARALRDSPRMAADQITYMYNAGLKAQQIETELRGFAGKFPKERARWEATYYLGHAYARESNPQQAARAVGTALPHAASTHSIATYYVQWMVDTANQARGTAFNVQLTAEKNLAAAKADETAKRTALAKIKDPKAKQAAQTALTLATALVRKRAQELQQSQTEVRAKEQAFQKQVAAADKALTAALKPTQLAGREHDGLALRYALSRTLYHERAKDAAKALAHAREAVKEAHVHNNNLQTLIYDLLSRQTDGGQFRNDVAQLLTQRRNHLAVGYYRDYVSNWVSAVKSNKEHRAKARFVSDALAKQNREPLVQAVLRYPRPQDNVKAAIPLRAQALTQFSNLSRRNQFYLVDTQRYALVHYARKRDPALAKQISLALLQKYPKDHDAAAGLLWLYLNSTDKTDAKKYTQQFLRLSPMTERVNTEFLRNLMKAAELNEDAALANQIYQWAIRGRVQPTYSDYFGDVLWKLGQKNQALDWWKRVVEAPSEGRSEERNCAERFLTNGGKASAAMREQIEFRWPELAIRVAAHRATDELRKQGNADAFARTVAQLEKQSADLPFINEDWLGFVDTWRTYAINNASYIGTDNSAYKDFKPLDDAAKLKVYVAVRDLRARDFSAWATCDHLMAGGADAEPPVARLLRLLRVTRDTHNDHNRWNTLRSYAQKAFEQERYVESATLLTGALAHLTNVPKTAKDEGRGAVLRAHSRMGAVGLTIDENSPMAPLLTAALYLRLGDREKALELYQDNAALFAAHRNDLPPDLIEFVCNHLMTGGDEARLAVVEDFLRGWLIKFTDPDKPESKQQSEDAKARLQLLLAKSYYKGQRYDVARAEYSTVTNRYAGTPHAIEAKFGIGESFMAQKIYDKAAQAFKTLEDNPNQTVSIRAEFLTGLLAFRQEQHDAAREKFQHILERVPDVELANRTLFSLSEIYGLEQRFLQQLNLLRTVGRLGHQSKRLHVPGTALSIVVHDRDLGVSRGKSRIPVVVTTHPGGDKELVYLRSTAGAGKGLFRGEVDTTLGTVALGDGVLQLTGKDVIASDYPPEFKAQFRTVPLSDVEIRVAADGEFAVASSEIIDAEEETLTQQLEREQMEANADRRVSQGRPTQEVKPGNRIFLRIKDRDRDLGDSLDKLTVTLRADSGDQVQVNLVETGPHTGEFRAAIPTAELPAGAAATDSAIGHSPLMAIDHSRETFWQSEPDGLTPKLLTVDMKQLHTVSRVRVNTPHVSKNAPVRGRLLGSYDGVFWFTIVAHPPLPEAQPVSGKTGAMQQRIFAGDYTGYETWAQVSQLGRTGTPKLNEPTVKLAWSVPNGEAGADQPHAAIWHGQLVQRREGAMRIAVKGDLVAIAINGKVQLAPSAEKKFVDVWLKQGVHEAVFFSATKQAARELAVSRARANVSSSQPQLKPFIAEDFDVAGVRKFLGENHAPAAPQLQPVAMNFEQVEFRKITEKFGVTKVNNLERIGFWQNAADWMKWVFDAPRAGTYELWMQSSHANGGSKFRVEFGDQLIEGTVLKTGDWNRFAWQRVGLVQLEAAGAQILSIKPVEIAGGGLMDLAKLELRPVMGAGVIQRDREWEFFFDPVELRFARLQVDEYLGDSVAINHMEIRSTEQTFIPTKVDVSRLAQNASLEIAGGDVVTASYTDEIAVATQGGSRLLTQQLKATYNDARVVPIGFNFSRNGAGTVQQTRKELLRIDPGDRITFEVVDYDMDQTDERDTVPVEVWLNGAKWKDLIAAETEEYSGIFRVEVDTAAAAAEGKLVIQKGDRIFCRYADLQNTFPGHSVDREGVVFANEPTEGVIRLIGTRRTQPPADSEAPSRPIYLPTPEDVAEPVDVNFFVPLTVEVIDPDAAKDSLSTVNVLLNAGTTNAVEVTCVLSTQFGDFSNLDPGEVDPALRMGRFVGQVKMQLGGEGSPMKLPRALGANAGVIGRARPAGAGEDAEDDNLLDTVLNVNGQTVLQATYQDVVRPNNIPVELAHEARLSTDGAVGITDEGYDEATELLHMGEKLFVRVQDPDLDITDERDTATVIISSESGEKESVKLQETLSHSGVFTGSFELKAREKPTVANFSDIDREIECFFGDTLTATYTDSAAGVEVGEVVLSLEVPVAIGTDGIVTAFSKIFGNQQLAVQTQFHIAESYFELFKNNLNLERPEESDKALKAGRRVLKEIMVDYPNPKYLPRIAYLSGQFSQELKDWNEAANSYILIVRQHPNHTLAADAQYKLAQCFEEAEDFDRALEEYVTLAATYPKSPLIPNVMIRINEYFYKRENFTIAAKVAEKFMDRFGDHAFAPKMCFRWGQCYYKNEAFAKAGGVFDLFVKKFPDDGLSAQSIFWAGESYRSANNVPFAFRRYNRCRWDFPESEAAKYARGRLALPEMLAQFEAEANSIDNDN